MAVTKNGKLSFTQEQYDYARYEASALDYALANNYELEKSGRHYRMKEHDSMVFTENGGWFWNSRNMKGGAIEFITQYEHKSLVEAVLTLSEEKVFEHQSTNEYTSSKEREAREPIPSAARSFELPERAINANRVFAYLSKTRKIDSDIVKQMVSQNRIYQSKAYGNAVFVGFDEKGNPQSAFQRGTLSEAEKPFKVDVENSKKEFPFHMPGKADSITVAVFESCIDAMSHATLEKIANKEYDRIHRISLGGTAPNALDKFLEMNPTVKTVILCLDNDTAGKYATEQICKHLLSKNNDYTVWSQEPLGKDFN
ncbi:MAG: DUF3991 and TOPRIM domain-containing protein, partial [Oscillospiraceae bacterium]